MAAPARDVSGARRLSAVQCGLSLLVTALVACSGASFRSGDALKAIHSGRVTALQQQYARNLQTYIEQANEDPTGTRRNQLLNDFIFLVDTNYGFWAKNAYNKKAFGDFGSDFAATTLSTLSGIVTGGGVQGAKSILSFIAAGVTSTHGQFTKSVLQDQNLTAILTKTRALRTSKLIPLSNGMYAKTTTGLLQPRPLSQYPVEQGLIDLAAYYEAGTFVAAIQDITDKAAAERIQAQGTIDNTIKNIPSLEAEAEAKSSPAPQ
jgi:hypothetical protein